MQDIKTTRNLREILSAELTALRNKKTTPQRLNAICNATGKYISTIRLDIEMAKFMGIKPGNELAKLTWAANGKK